MANKITLHKIDELLKPDENRLIIHPSHLELGGVPSGGFSTEVEKQIIEEAKKTDYMCVATVTNSLGRTFLYGGREAKGCSSRAYILNAEECDPFQAEAFVAIFNTGRGALTEYWWKAHIKFKKGGIV